MGGACEKGAGQGRGGAAGLRVVEVEGGRDLRRFLGFPYRRYRGDPCWVAPLPSQQKSLLDPRRNPFWQHARRRLFLALRGSRGVGRIAAIANRAHEEFHGERVGFFGFFEVEEDPEAARALLDRVEASHREAGMECLRGPVSPSMGGECGLLVQGFETPPTLLMPYNPPSYAGYLEDFGLRKEIDLLAYHMERGDEESFAAIRARLARLEEVARHRHPGMRLRPLDRAHLRRDASILRDVFDGARRRNYGFVPSTEPEFDYQVAMLGRIADPDFIHILELDGRPAGCVVALPDWNVALRRSQGLPGPLRLARIAWERRRIRTLRVVAIALSEGTRRSGLVSVLMRAVVEAAVRRGYRGAELSWVAENNTVQVHTLEGFVGGGAVKRYRIYSKPIPPGDAPTSPCARGVRTGG